MIKKYIVLSALILTVSIALSGCFDRGSGALGQTTPTAPPQKEYKSIEEFSNAVAAAKADTAAADDANLKTITSYYELKTLPEGTKVSHVKVTKDTIQIGYEFGPTKAGSFDNQLEIAWYRTAKIDTFLSDVANTLGSNYDTLSIGGNDFLHVTPSVLVAVTPTPGSSLAADATAAPTPTPASVKFCQIVYWVKDGGAFMSAVPLGYSNDDIGKYCEAQKVDLK
jgi:hypothetical protein